MGFIAYCSSLVQNDIDLRGTMDESRARPGLESKLGRIAMLSNARMLRGCGLWMWSSANGHHPRGMTQHKRKDLHDATQMEMYTHLQNTHPPDAITVITRAPFWPSRKNWRKCCFPEACVR